MRFRATLAALTLAPLLLLACGARSSSSATAFTELQHVAGLRLGQPILVFVYTDG